MTCSQSHGVAAVGRSGSQSTEKVTHSDQVALPARIEAEGRDLEIAPLPALAGGTWLSFLTLRALQVLITMGQQKNLFPWSSCFFVLLLVPIQFRLDLLMVGLTVWVAER